MSISSGWPGRISRQITRIAVSRCKQRLKKVVKQEEVINHSGLKRAQSIFLKISIKTNSAVHEFHTLAIDWKLHQDSTRGTSLETRTAFHAPFCCFFILHDVVIMNVPQFCGTNQHAATAIRATMLDVGNHRPRWRYHVD